MSKSTELILNKYMLTHLQPNPSFPKRIVVLGAAGFVAKATIRHLEASGATVLALPRTELDLTSPDAGSRLRGILNKNDSLLFVSAKAPVRNEAMLLENIQMCVAVCEVLKQNPVRHVVYISSDAVYTDSDEPLTERSAAQPASLHGIMHLSREVMLANAFNGPLCYLRPTLIYGNGDPHNGYGPNRFMRQAASGKDIDLFGEGEERRDHVWIEDVAEVTCKVLFHLSQGVLNVASGDVVSFSDIAKQVSHLLPGSYGIKTRVRVGPMPHNGFRAFDISVLRSAFPNFLCTPLNVGLQNLALSVVTQSGTKQTIS